MNESDNRFWLFMVGSIMVGLLLTLLLSLAYWQGKNRLIVEMVSKGADPIEAACSLELGHSYVQDCLVLMQQESKQ